MIHWKEESSLQLICNIPPPQRGFQRERERERGGDEGRSTSAKAGVCFGKLDKGWIMLLGKMAMRMVIHSVGISHTHVLDWLADLHADLGDEAMTSPLTHPPRATFASPTALD